MKITHIGAENCVTGSCHLVQAAGSPGRTIMEGSNPAVAAIHRLTGYSAHADQQTLCEWLAAMPDPRDRSVWCMGNPEPKTLWPKG